MKCNTFLIELNLSEETQQKGVAILWKSSFIYHIRRGIKFIEAFAKACPRGILQR
jgi:hypothetical protein